MTDRTLNWGESEAAARYQTGDSDPDGGDFIVAKNTDNETVLLQFDNTDEQWVFAGDVDLGGNDVTNAGLLSGVDGSFDTLEAESASTEAVSTEELLNGRTSESLITQSSVWKSGYVTPLDDPDDVTATSFTSVTESVGGITPGPDGTSLYGRFIGRTQGVTDGETLTVVPNARKILSLETERLSELEVETSSTGAVVLDSGWQKITTLTVDEPTLIRRLDAKVTGGTGELQGRSLWGVGLDWRVD